MNLTRHEFPILPTVKLLINDEHLHVSRFLTRSHSAVPAGDLFVPYQNSVLVDASGFSGMGVVHDACFSRERAHLVAWFKEAGAKMIADIFVTSVTVNLCEPVTFSFEAVIAGDLKWALPGEAW